MLTRRNFLFLSAVLAASRVSAADRIGDQRIAPLPPEEQHAAPGVEPWLEVMIDSKDPRDLALIEEKYAALRKYLSAELTLPLKLVVTGSETVGEHPANSVLVAPPIVITRALSYAYTPLAQTISKDKLVFIARANMRANKLVEFKGSRLGLPQKGSQAEFVARKALAKLGIVSPEQFFGGSIQYHTGQESMLKAVQAGVVDVGVMLERALPVKEPGIRKLLTTQSYATYGLSVRNASGTLGFERMRKALFLPTEEGRKAIEEAGLAPLDPIDKAFFAGTSLS